MSGLDYNRIRYHVIEVAREAGRIILNAQPTSSLSHTAKKNGEKATVPFVQETPAEKGRHDASVIDTDIVTETDGAVEAFISERLRSAFPEIGFLGEESHRADRVIDEAPTFIVDPIDGTSNFVHGFPAVCVSIGLVERRRPVVGVVYNPFYDELWHAAKGAGAFTEKAGGDVIRLPLRKPPLEGLGKACVGIEWGSDREGPNFELNLKVFTTLARTRRTGGRMTNSLRCTGSAAIAISRVAAGQQDLFWECGCWAWDVAAAWCILGEAGGRMVDGHPAAWDDEPPIDNRRYLAVRPAPAGQRDIVEELWAVIGEYRSTYGPP